MNIKLTNWANTQFLIGKDKTKFQTRGITDSRGEAYMGRGVKRNRVIIKYLILFQKSTKKYMLLRMQLYGEKQFFVKIFVKKIPFLIWIINSL